MSTDDQPPPTSYERMRARERERDRRRSEDPDFRAKRAAYLKEYSQRPAVIATRRATHRVSQMAPEVLAAKREWERQWRLANPGRKIQAYPKPPEDPVKKAARRARNRATRKGAHVENVDRSEIWTRDGGTCHICSESADPTAWDLDHVVPLSKGGVHAPWNVRVSHPLCNRRKHDNDPREPGSRYAYLLEVS